MTKPELEEALQLSEASLTEANQIIQQLQLRVAEGDVARDRCFDLERQIEQLNAKLAAVKTSDVWDKLTEGWMNSAIGKRALLTPGVDLTGFHMGVDRQNFKLVQLAYAQVLEMLKLAGVPATVKEQQEIGILLKTLGFV